MTISTYNSPSYLIDDIEDLLMQKYSDNKEMRKILEEFKQDLQLIHNFIRKLNDFENEKIDKRGIISEYNLYRSGKSMNLFGGIV